MLDHLHHLQRQTVRTFQDVKSDIILRSTNNYKARVSSGRLIQRWAFSLIYSEKDYGNI